MKRLRYKNGQIDGIDVKLLNVLADNARTSIADLARLVRLSAPTVAERMKRLEEAGVIESYTLTINPKALGLPIAAWLRIRPLPGQLAKVANILRDLREVVECDRITGEDCFIARAHVMSVDALEKLIDQIIPYATTNTSIVQSSPLRRRMPPISQTSRDTSGDESGGTARKGGRAVHLELSRAGKSSDRRSISGSRA
jgi:Lrp/AsnC family transcriptional regulator, leucine-responsive regulatory protein